MKSNIVNEKEPPTGVIYKSFIKYVTPTNLEESVQTTYNNRM